MSAPVSRISCSVYLRHPRRAALLAGALTTTLACGPEPAPTGPDLAKGGAAAALTVSPASLEFSSPSAAPALLQASVQFVGLITATTSGTACVTAVPQSMPATKAPGSSVYLATFSVTPRIEGTCTVIVTDKKGNQVRVPVTVRAAGPAGIVFVSTRGGTDADIYRMDPDGSNLTPLAVSDDIEEREPAISPDRHRIAFVGIGDQIGWEIYLMNADGSGRTKLTSNSGLGSYPVFTPDGGRIVYVSQKDVGSGELYSVRVDGLDEQRLTNNTVTEQQPAIAPDGRIAFSLVSDPNFYIMDADGSNMALVGEGEQPAFSPDGKEVAFVSARDGDPEIYVMDLTTRATRQLTDNDQNDGDPVFSPDGTKIAFVSARDGNFEIYVMNASDGSGQANLSQNAADDGYPDWK
jgi:dipeptidyl aminopeptidase/acylaminoacyl peptidase